MPVAETKQLRGPRNGVDTPALFTTLNAVKGQPDLAKFQFRVTNRWLKGTKSRSRIEPFRGAGGVHAHKTEYAYDADHPAVLVGGDEGATPAEFVLHALAACITAGIANIAAARGVTLTEVTSTVEGDINLLGLLGIDPEIRNGYERIRITFDVKGEATAEKLREVVEQSRARSAVFDILTKGVPVELAVNAA